MTSALFSEILLPITLVIVTTGLGLSITVTDIKNIFLQPKSLLVGFLSQMLILPAIALVIIVVTKLEPVYAVGLIIIAMCPGGVTTNLLTYMLKTNVAPSISIAAANGLFSTIKIPILVTLTLMALLDEKTRIELPFWDAFLKIFLITIVPAAFGILVRRWKPKIADSLNEPLRYILPILMLLVYAGIIFLEEDGSQRDFSTFFYLLPFALALNLLSMVAGYYIPTIFGLAKNNKITITVEIGLQNSTLAIFIASTLLKNNDMALVAVVYGSFSFFTTWLFGYFAKKYL